MDGLDSQPLRDAAVRPVLHPAAQLDPRTVDWRRVGRTGYMLHERFTYVYARPIRRLRHRLVITPPAVHGGQRLTLRHVRVRPATGAVRVDTRDAFGNAVIEFHAARVERSIAFEAWFVVERSGATGVHREDAAGAARFLAPTHLTMPNAALRSVAESLQASGEQGAALGSRISSWVHAHLRYGFDVTDVGTDAVRALELGTGVCQDYAHVMLTLARLCGIPARYVSGHLLGEGGSHAWVELLLPDPGDPAAVIVHALDPTHDRPAGLQYLTVATGRDFADVTPTSGTFSGTGMGMLSTRKRADLVRVDYAA